MSTSVNWRLLGLVAFVGCAALVAWISWNRPPSDLHRQGRQFTVYQTLSRTSDAVVVLGDSMVEVSTLPRKVCGHAIVNAGLNGASTASDLGGWLTAALDGKRAAAIIVSLGLNDAMAARAPSQEEFAKRYGALLSQLSLLAPRLAVLELTSVEAQSNMTVALQDRVMAKARVYNDALRDVASKQGATWIAVPAMPAPHTLDGVHLNAEGYLIWDQAVMQAAALVCG
ncbi:MAG: hypothetical protein JWQ94_1190 [Tardiphaga sp.]|jgi:lysophospholipase L1-like esterase|nr:hypothetical protein [Tardiphaga sp.]